MIAKTNQAKIMATRTTHRVVNQLMVPSALKTESTPAQLKSKVTITQTTKRVTMKYIIQYTRLFFIYNNWENFISDKI